MGLRHEQEKVLLGVDAQPGHRGQIIKSPQRKIEQDAKIMVTACAAEKEFFDMPSRTCRMNTKAIKLLFPKWRVGIVLIARKWSLIWVKANGSARQLNELQAR